MRGVRMGSSSEVPDADQPDYDSVASDEDTDAEHSAKDDRTKVAQLDPRSPSNHMMCKMAIVAGCFFYPQV